MEHVELTKSKVKWKKAEREELAFRDGLTENAKIDYLFKRLRTVHFQGHTADFQKLILGIVRDGLPLPPGLLEQHCHAIEQVIKQLYGFSTAMYQNVIDRYIDEILPEIEAEQAA